MRSLLVRACVTLGALFVPALAFAHEVYVLTPAQIKQDVASPPFNEIAVATAHLSQFAFWGFLTAIVIFIVFFVSIIRPLERSAELFWRRTRPYAATIARVTVGISFLAAAYYQASFGPELPLLATFGGYTTLVSVVLVIMGLLMIFGVFARAAAATALTLFAISVYYHGVYMLTYTNYLGEILVLLILGAHHGASPHKAFRAAHQAAHGLERRLRDFATALAPYSFLILRVCFGVSLFYASYYAKIVHNDLALQVAELPLGHAHALATIFGLEPHFLVLGAAIIEIVIAVFFILGIEIRFTSLFLLFWLSLSLYYFGEVVWPHVILIGIPIAFIFYGYDKYSLEGAFMKHRNREPVL